MKETLREYIDSRGVKMRVDRGAGIIRGVKILGLSSRNGRRYPAETLLRAVGLYDGAKVNVNHAAGKLPGTRDYRDRIGSIRNVRLQPDEGLFADFHFNPKHALAEQLVWDAEHAAENVGFSHNVRAKTSRRGEQVQVEEILKVESVDLVADPATTQGLFESAPEPESNDAETVDGGGHGSSDALQESFYSGLSVESLRRHRPDLVEKLYEENRDELQSLRREIDCLRESALAQSRGRLIGELLAESNLPVAASDDYKAVVGPRFMQLLHEAPDEQTVRELIRERAELVHAVEQKIAAAGGISGVSAGKPVCRGQIPLAEPAEDSNSFVKSIT